MGRKHHKNLFYKEHQKMDMETLMNQLADKLVGSDAKASFAPNGDSPLVGLPAPGCNKDNLKVTQIESPKFGMYAYKLEFKSSVDGKDCELELCLRNKLQKVKVQDGYIKFILEENKPVEVKVE